VDRTIRAALFTAVITFAVIAGLGVFLGFEVGASLIAGALAAAVGGLLLWGASRRADSFHPTDPNAHLREVRPSFPGEPEPAASTEDDDPRTSGDDTPDTDGDERRG
jgi:hypothetical protein